MTPLRGAAAIAVLAFACVDGGRVPPSTPSESGRSFHVVCRGAGTATSAIGAVSSGAASRVRQRVEVGHVRTEAGIDSECERR